MYRQIKFSIGISILVILLITTVSGGDSKNYIEITNNKHFQENFNENKTVVYFGATWCAPCKTFKSSLSSIAKQEKDITILLIDIDKCPDLATTYKIETVPQLIVKKKRIIGNKSQEYIHNFILESLK